MKLHRHEHSLSDKSRCGDYLSKPDEEWGTANLHRGAVRLEPNAPKTIIGHVREIGVLKWIGEGNTTPT